MCLYVDSDSMGVMYPPEKQRKVSSVGSLSGLERLIGSLDLSMLSYSKYPRNQALCGVF